MSQENVEIVRGVYEAAARRDSKAVFALYDEDIEWDVSRTQRGAVTGPGGRGHDLLRTWLREWYGAWEKVDDVLEEIIDAGGSSVISVMLQRGRGKASGAEVEDRIVAVWTVEEGKVVRVTWFPTRAKALEAAGLSE